MTRKDYEAMAAELRASRSFILSIARTAPGFAGISTTAGAATLNAILHDYTRAVARVFAADNSRFDCSRFIAAAGFER